MVSQVHGQATRMGALRAVALCRCFGGALHFQNGDWSAATADLVEAIDLYRKLGGASGEALSLQRYGVLLTAQGKLDQAMAAFDEGVFAAERATMRSHCLTRLYASMARNRLAANDLRAATDAMHLGETTADRHGHCVTCNALLLPEAVRVSIALDDLAGARVAAAQLALIARDFASVAWMAMARQAAGRVAASARKWDEGEAAFGEAASAYHTINSPYEEARCLTSQANVLRHSKGQVAGERAAVAENEARQILTRIGAPGIED
jgi:tetratricopeptide (TPR) repeat protein